MSNKIITLDEFIIKRQNEFLYDHDELTGLLRDIGVAAKIVNRLVNKAGLVNILGKADSENISGDTVQKLDLYANEKLIECLKNSGQCCGIASEEDETFLQFPSIQGKEANYVVAFDPLDGSSNIDVNVSVGTIFSVFRRITPIGTPVTIEDFLQSGINQVAAGYVIYGTSTMLVYTTGHGVNGFTLNPAIGTFYLSHPNIQFPKDGIIYSINEGNYVHFPQGVKDYIKYCQLEEEERPYTSRYIGSLVSDIHRNMIKGGIYLYPTSTKAPKGKLRLLYECNPMAFIVEQAGGKASDGWNRIMEIQPKELHERAPFFCGSFNMVEKAEDFMRLAKLSKY